MLLNMAMLELFSDNLFDPEEAGARAARSATAQTDYLFATNRKGDIDKKLARKGQRLWLSGFKRSFNACVSAKIKELE